MVGVIVSRRLSTESGIRSLSSQRLRLELSFLFSASPSRVFLRLNRPRALMTTPDVYLRLFIATATKRVHVSRCPSQVFRCKIVHIFDHFKSLVCRGRTNPNLDMAERRLLVFGRRNDLVKKPFECPALRKRLLFNSSREQQLLTMKNQGHKVKVMFAD